MVVVCITPGYLGLTSLTGMLRRAAMSSTVSLPSEMMPTPLAMAFAVIGWSPVTMITCETRRRRSKKYWPLTCLLKHLLKNNIYQHLVAHLQWMLTDINQYFYNISSLPASLVSLWKLYINEDHFLIAFNCKRNPWKRHLDPSTPAFPHSIGHGGTRRVNHGHESHEAQVFRGEVNLFGVKLEALRKLVIRQVQVTEACEECRWTLGEIC